MPYDRLQVKQAEIINLCQLMDVPSTNGYTDLSFVDANKHS